MELKVEEGKEMLIQGHCMIGLGFLEASCSLSFKRNEVAKLLHV